MYVLVYVSKYVSIYFPVYLSRYLSLCAQVYLSRYASLYVSQYKHPDAYHCMCPSIFIQICITVYVPVYVSRYELPYMSEYLYPDMYHYVSHRPMCPRRDAGHRGIRGLQQRGRHHHPVYRNLLEWCDCVRIRG